MIFCHLSEHFSIGHVLPLNLAHGCQENIFATNKIWQVSAFKMGHKVVLFSIKSTQLPGQPSSLSLKVKYLSNQWSDPTKNVV